MSSARTFASRLPRAVVAAFFVCAAILPSLLSRRAEAAQMTERRIEISTSKVSATDVTYTISFKPATSIPTAQGIVIDFCDSPLVGTACVNTTNTAGFSTNESGLAVSAPGMTLDAATDANTVILTGSTALTAGTTYTIVLGSTGATDGITNPSYKGSFYARILTYSSAATAQAYTDTGTGYVDAGGVAMSTANQITINARVQEVLVFCVGTTDAGTTNDCGDISGTTVDLGVVQAGALSISPVLATSGGNNSNGLAMVRTNAVNGVTVNYFAEPVTGDAGTGHLGSLRVSGTNCAGGNAIGAADEGDQCFNSAGTTQMVFSTSPAVSREGFGMTIGQIDTTNGSTTNLVRDAEYDGDGTNGAGQGWAWSGTTPDTIASSPTVVDDEMLVLRFAAQAAVTTPTGQYGVTSTYVATSSF